MAGRIEPSFGRIEESELKRESGAPRSGVQNNPRKPWLALLLSLFCSPAAFAYVGRISWAFVLYGVILLTLAALGLTGLVQSVIGIWSLIGVAIIVQLAMIFLPWLFARKAKNYYFLKGYNRWYWYPVLATLVLAPVGYLALHKERYFGFGNYRVPSGAMAPTIGIGDLIVADTRDEAVRTLTTGDVAVLTFPRQPDVLLVKRIAAMPGQHVKIDADGVTVDGKLQDGAQTQGDNMLDAKWMRYAEITLGPDELFVMGDNRGNSIDSRTEGPVTRDRLRAKATTIYYSQNTARIGPIK